jgi:phi13 family phage major tail protein
MAKNYSAFTGVDEFIYKVIGEDEVQQSTPERVKYLQEVEVEREEDIVRAYGDNVTAELAKSAGSTTLKSTFHKIPTEDKAKLFSLKNQDGLYFVGNNGSNYIACMFARTTETGTEYVGLFKGIFKLPSMSGQTKEDKVEFSNEESEAEFMEVDVNGIEGKQSFVLGYDEKGSTKNRDAIYKLVFGQEHPNAGSVSNPAEEAGA